MRGKFTTKTIIIAVIALLVLAAAVTSTVVFLKDSGEAAAAQEQELLNNMQNEESKEKNDDTTKEGENLPELGDEEERTNQSNTGNANINNTNNNRVNNDTLEEPAPSTVERERVVSETTTLGWNDIGLNSEIGANDLEIVYSNLEYTVEYYFEELLADDLSVTIGENSKGKVIDTYEDKVKVGYKLDKVENFPLTITENEESNVIKVFYIKDEEQVKNISYTVKYFIENKEQEADRKVITETVWVNAEETMTFDSSLLDKKYTGYEKVETRPETVGEKVNNGDVIEVYYAKDEEQVKDISYTVKYFVEEKEQEADRKVITETVWINAEETMTFDSSLLNKEYVGYKKVATNPETVGNTVNNGDVIEVYYEKDEEQVKDISYTVKYFIEDKEQESDRKVVTETVWVNAKELMTFDSSLLNKEYIGYKKVGTNPETVGNTVNNGDVIEIYYEKDSFRYTTNYYKDSITEANYLDKVEGIATFEEEITADVTKFKPEGYEFVGTAPSIIIKANVSENIINVVYTKASFGYTINYYKDSITEANYLDKVEGIATFGSTVTADITKFIPEGYEFVGTAPSIVIKANTSENVINVVYTKASFEYRINYYKDSISENNYLNKVEGTATFGATVTADTTKFKPTGYEFIGTAPGMVIKANTSENVINVVYTKASFGYRINYYKDSISENNYLNKVEETATFEEEITADITKFKPEGYEFVGTAPSMVIKATTSENVINVVYTKASFRYTIYYYKDSIEGANLLGRIPGTAEYKAKITADITELKPIGYEFIGTAPSMVIEANATENILNVVYVKADFGYTVKYYKDSITESNYLDKIEGTTAYATKITADITKFKPTGYEFIGTAPSMIIKANASENIINVVYTKANFGYTVKYYKDSITENNYLDKVEGTATFGSTVTADTTKFIPIGYEFTGTAPSMVIKVDSSKNIINVVYTKADIVYTVKYYKDSITENNYLNKVEGIAIFGSTVTADTTKFIPTGYEFKGISPSMIIKANASENIIDVVYTKASFGYTVKYYYNGKTVSSVPSVKYTAQYGEIINYTSDMDKTNENGGGWSLDPSRPVEQLVIGAIEADNFINIYYVKPVITIEKSANKSKANIKENITYTITLRNSGGLEGTRTVTDTLPEGVTFVSTTDGSYNSTTRTVTWKDIKVPANNKVELDVTVKVNVNQLGATITNQADIISSNEKDSFTTQINTVTCSTQEIVKGEEAKDNVNVVLVLDISTSMNTTDRGNSKSRLELAKDAMKSFVNTLWANNTTNKDATISLILFNKTASIKQVNGKNISGISDKAALLSTISNIQTSTRGTDMWDGLDEAQSLITGTLKKTAPYSSNSNVIIFLGDGKPSNGSTSGNNSSGIISKASTIKGSSVGAEIYTIGFGAEAAKVSNDKDSAYYILKNMASTPSSDYFKTAITGSELAGIFTNIADSVSEKTGIVTGGLITISLEAGKTILVDKEHPLIVKSGSNELIRITTTPLPSYFDTTESGKIKFDANAYNLVAEEGKEIVSGELDLIYYVE